MSVFKNLANFGYGILAVLLVFLLPVAFIKGALWLVSNFSQTLGYIVMGTWGVVLAVLPMSLVCRLRVLVGNTLYGLSFVLGALFWLYCLYVVYSLWGVAGILVGLIFLKAIILPAALAVLFDSSHAFSERIIEILYLAGYVVLVYGLRWFGFWLVGKFSPKRFEPKIVRYGFAVCVGIVAGYIVPVPVFAALDYMLGDGKLLNVGTSAPLNWLVVLYMLAIGVVTGFIVGSMAEGRGKVLAAIAQLTPMIVMVIASLALNRDLLAGTGQDRAATWVWIGLIPAIIAGHCGQKYTHDLRMLFMGKQNIQISTEQEFL